MYLKPDLKIFPKKMSSLVLNIRAVWLYVLLVCVQVYAQENLIEIDYEYKIKSDPCSNNQQYGEYGDYIQTSCPTFVTTNQRIYDIISYSLNPRDIPRNHPLSLRIINSDNRTELSANDFSIYLFQRTTVLVLDLSDNNIQKIGPGVFIAFTDLVELSFTMNSLTELDNYLSPLLKLQKVDISRNSINTITDTSFANQLDLFVVDLSFNNISHIPKNLFTNQMYLEELLLQGNRIKQFDLNLPEPQGASLRLDLSYNLLETASMTEHFTDINQSHNNLTVFSLVVSPKLQSLDLSYNYIKVIDPSSFVNAVELYKLDLSHNLLTSIPTSSFKEVKKLQDLDLSHNLIHENSYGSDNNWYSFFLNFKELSQVTLDGNYWKCSDLKDFIYLITSNRAQLTPGSTHNTTNIHGIGCSPSNNTTTSSNKEITYNPSERIQSLINQQIAEEFKSLYLNYTSLLALQTKEANSVKAGILRLKVALNNLNTTFNATEQQKKINETVKEVISKLKVALNSLNKTFNETEQQKNINEEVKEEISKLKVSLNNLNTTLNATEYQKKLNEEVKEEISKLKVALNSLNTTLNASEYQKKLNEEVKEEISKLKMALNSLNTTLNATEHQKKLNEIVKEEMSKLKVALNSLNTTSPNLTMQEDVKTRISNEETMKKILLDALKTEISKLKEVLSPHPAEVKTMEPTQSGGNAGIIVNNICLVIITGCLIFFIYVYYKNKHVVKSFEDEHINLA